MNKILRNIYSLKNHQIFFSRTRRTANSLFYNEINKVSLLSSTNLALKYSTDSTKNNKNMESKQELRQRLTPLQYQVTQEAATERPYSGIYNKHNEKGTYQCIVCHQDLFASDTKFDAGCGWPAFNDVLDKGKVKLQQDNSIAGGNILLVMKDPSKFKRQEVLCNKCNAHLGHLFEDGPKPTGKRFCINSNSLDFAPTKSAA